ncbi:hypothetical protein BJI48_06230 [Helicobacter sp. 11S02596-1]|nr:hypothetical protein BJI48_06230 [Helicobacter sp. 11S02596-1]
MDCKYRCFLILLGVNVIGALVCYGVWHTAGVMSFEAAFLSFCLVLWSAYSSLKRKINKEITQADLLQTKESPSEIEENLEENKDAKAPKTKFSFSSFILGLQLSMGFFRILAYVILIGVVVVLMNKNMFSVLPYFIGIGVSLVATLSLAYLSQNSSSAKKV